METSCNLVISSLFYILLSFLIISISTESNLQITNCPNLQLTPNNTKCTNFTYTESTQNTTSPQSQPYAIDIQFYDDGTSLIHLVRNNNTEHCFEPILRIRIIHLNGSVTEINTNLNLDSVNYCLFNDTGKMVNPISIRPLKKPFILVSYMNTTNSEYWEEWGAVLNWDGEILSSISITSSIPLESPKKSLIEININKELGFLRAVVFVDFINATQYSVDANGNLSLLSAGILLSYNTTIFTSLTTADEGYLILYVTYKNQDDFLSPLGGLYASFVAYNKTFSNPSDNPILLFQITRPHMKINAVHCDAHFGFCYYCVASIIYNNTVYYEEIIFCQETSIIFNQLHRIPNETNVPWSVSSTPVGGYIFSAVVDTTCFIYIYDIDHYLNYAKVNLTYFNTTSIGAYSILKNNNTLLFSLRDTNSKNTTWSLLAVQLPKTS
ncbi:11274_t:CDS:2, partial [Dentiscutata heterogama]